MNFLKFSACSDYNQTHMLNWVTLHGNLLRKCHGYGACYRALLFTLSSHSSGSLFVGLFCKAQPSVQLWEKCGIKVPESSLTLTLISFACHYPFVWMAVMLRLDLWRKHRSPGAYAILLLRAAADRKVDSIQVYSMKFAWFKSNVLNKRKYSPYWQQLFNVLYESSTSQKLIHQLETFSSGALRILFAGWRGK